MHIVRRLYSGETDKPRIVSLFHATAADYLHVTDLPYRLNSPAFDLSADDRIALFRKENQERANA